MGKAAGVIDLQAGQCTCLFNGIRQPFQSGQVVVGIHPQGPVGTAAPGMVHRRIFDHDHGHTALGHEPVVFQQHIAYRAALAGIAQVERRHGQAILQGSGPGW